MYPTSLLFQIASQIKVVISLNVIQVQVPLHFHLARLSSISFWAKQQKQTLHMLILQLDCEKWH